MLTDVTLPQLGESVTEGTISKWLVGEGDIVTKDQPLVSVATDKADAEVSAPASGRVAKIVAPEGQTVPVRALLCQIEEGATKPVAPPAAAPAPGASPVATPPRTDTAPQASVTPQASGAGATAGTPNVGYEGANFKAPSSGGSDKVPQPSPPSAPLGAGDGQRSATGGNMATPTARKAALEREVNIDAVAGSGGRGRVTRDDVLRAAGNNGSHGIGEGAHASPGAPGPGGAAASGNASAQSMNAPGPNRTAQLAQLVNQGGGFVPPIPGAGYGAFKVPAYRPTEGDRVIPFTRRRRITADHMVYSKFASPHVVTVAEVDLHKASRLRETNKDRYKKEGLGLTMLAFVVVACARALRESDALNARVLEDAYVVFKDINIGVAVDSPEGLVVPVVRRADELGVRGVVRTVDELAKRAKTGKITVDDLSGATFSVSNPGLKGNLFGGAIINQPNVGILRIGEIQKRVVVIEGPDGSDHMAIHPVMYMALSYDHRIVDGVAANAFLWRVTELLEKAEFEV